MAKKKNNRIRQTRTSWQKVFDDYPGVVQPFSWKSRLPETILISLALIDNDFEAIKKYLFEFSNAINLNHNQSSRFIFTFSQFVEIFKKEPRLIREVYDSPLGKSFSHTLSFYNDYLELDLL